MAKRHRTKKIFSLSIGIALSFVFLFGEGKAVAQDANIFGIAEAQPSSLGNADLILTITRIINVALGLLGIIAVGIILYAGFLYMTAGGEEDKVATAKRMLLNGVIGLAIILSAYAIARFVIERLAGATGGGEADISVNCTDPAYAAANPRRCAPGSFNCDDDRTCCTSERFVVLAITPSAGPNPGTPTGMNNIRPRAVFSQSVASDIPANIVFRIAREGTDVSSEFAFSYTRADRRVVEARPTAGNAPSGNYTVIVSNDLRDDEGNPLEESVSCGFFDQTASFSVDTTGVADGTLPIPGHLTIAGSVEEDIPLPRGEVYPIQSAISDESGIGYVQLEIVREVGGARVVAYDGPAVSRGSSARLGNEYPFTYSLVIPSNAPTLERYLVTMTVWDVDNNSQTTQTSYVIVGEHCDNGILDLDEGETDVDFGGSCRGNGSCTADWQCFSERCDETTSQCIAAPIILDVDPWDGAGGNWITVQGRYFGENIGEISFAYDRNNNGSIDADEWRPASLAQCGASDVWNDQYLIVEVPPNDSVLPPGSRSAIRVRHALFDTTTNPDFFDTTVDDIGPIPGPNSGLFTKNSTRRPGLCRITPPVGEPDAPVTLAGNGLGASPTGNDIVFGSVEARATAWNDAEIETQVPLNMDAARVGVFVRVDGEESNGVPFDVLREGEVGRPTVTGVDPETTRWGSFVTIYGRGFGTTVGTVYLAPNANTVCTATTCLTANPVSNALCTETWQDTQIVVEISNAIPFSAYAVFVADVGGVQSNGNYTLTVEPGPPDPSICRLDPPSGPAPLLGTDTLLLSGVNFGNPVDAYFWSVGSVADDLATWLRAPAVPRTRTAGVDSIRTAIPVLDGYSMQTGPIRIENGDGRLSNSVRYTVNDCREMEPDELPDGFQCCQQSGILRSDLFACPGEVRDAGFVWRFTTGKIPNVPYVVEGCDVANWNNATISLPFPSPTPWQQWPRGDAVCLNADIAVRFSMGMDATTLIANNLRLFTCGTGPQADCDDAAVDISGEIGTPPYGADVLTIRSGTAILLPNTWYRAVLLDGIQSDETVDVLRVPTIVNAPLLATKPCGNFDRRDSAYCFEFKTGGSGDLCVLSGVGIRPPDYTVNALGPLLDPRNPSNPFYYYLWGRGTAECTVMNVDNRGWAWSTSDGAQASATVAPQVIPVRYTDTRATGDALLPTAPQSVEIRAFARIESRDYTGLSDLIIDIGDPRVVDFWPNCKEACVNAAVGVRFNRPMYDRTYAGNFNLYRCVDGKCYPDGAAAAGALGMVVGLTMTNQTPTILEGEPINLLPDTWYQLEVANIQAIGGYRGGDPIAGRAMRPFLAKFRTKSAGSNADALCTVARVVVEPQLFTAHSVGEKTTYAGIPFGSPDACSAVGQRLSAWGFGWQWETADQSVATVTNFLHYGDPKSYCSYACLASGSDIVRGSGAVGLCGNGAVDPGEDCDLAIGGEIPGTSCTYACLRPGNNTAACGNGTVEPFVGEECDTGDTGTQAFCTPTCTWQGSSRETPALGDVPTPQCGNNYVSNGEDCEVGEYNETVVTCSSACLHRGTPLAQAWCDANGSNATRTVCASAVSICGNDMIEADEECEIISGIVFAAPAIRTNAAAVRCNDRCVFQNICGTDVPLALRCTPGDEGCNADCTLAGASVGYAVSSICGDGALGTGEFAWCEYTSAEVTVANIPGQNPVQAVTAVGDGAVDPQTLSMETNVNARAVAVALDNQPPQAVRNQPSDTGDYTLQCGYTEFDTPRIVTESSLLVTLYNDCQNRGQGVGTNSCCYDRNRRTEEYPVDGAGLPAGPSGAVCLNTFISVTISGEISEQSLVNNIAIARGHAAANYDCIADGGTDVTNMVNTTMPLRYQAFVPQGFFPRLWAGVKRFFGRLLGGIVRASEFGDRNVDTWCAGVVRAAPEIVRIRDAGGNITATEVLLPITTLLDAYATYAVFLRGGTSGIKDARGVGIRSGDLGATGLNDSILFRTGNEVCKLAGVSVEPAQYLFVAPNTAAPFQAITNSTNNQRIVSIPNIYAWDWSWGPQNHPVFDIPTEIPPDTTLTISSRTVEGQADGVANATVTVDVDTQNNQLNQVFSGATALTALFCENPWPPREYYPYEEGIPHGRALNNDGFNLNLTPQAFDGSELPPVTIGGNDIYFNFSMGYCADAGRSGDRDDDLPYLKPRVIGNLATNVPVCPPGEILVNRACVPEPPECPTGFALQNGECQYTAQCPVGYTLSNGSCLYPSGAGYDPRHIDSITQPARGVNYGLNLPVDVDYFEQGGNQYVAVVGGGGASPALQVIDVTDSNNPQSVSIYPANPVADRSLSNSDEVVVFHQSGTSGDKVLAYVISRGVYTDQDGQGNIDYVGEPGFGRPPMVFSVSPAFTVVDITDPANPRQLSRYTGAGDPYQLSYGNTRSVYGDPCSPLVPPCTVPSYTGLFENDSRDTRYEPTALGVSTDGTRAFVGVTKVSGPPGNAWGFDGVAVLNVSDPANIFLENMVDSQDGFGELAEPRQIFATDTRLYVTGGVGSGTGYYLTAFDITRLSNITRVGRLAGVDNPYLFRSVAAISRRQEYLHVVSSRDGMGVVDIRTDALTDVEFPPDTNLFRALAATTVGNHLLVTTYLVSGVGADTVQSYDISNPRSPVFFGSLEDGEGGAVLTNTPNSITTNFSGTRAYVTVRVENRLEILNLELPQPEVPTCPVRTWSPPVTLSGNNCVAEPTCVFPFSPSGNDCVRPSTGAGSESALRGATFSGALKQFLFVNDQNDDAIGIQIFDNTSPPAPAPAPAPGPEAPPDQIGNPNIRLSVRQWYEQKFGPVPSRFRKVTVDGYEALTDGNNYYVHQLNLGQSGEIFNNITLFSINGDAQEGTRRVFDALLDSLNFNINMTDHGYCSVGATNIDIDIPDTNPSVACITDYDCLSVEGSARICANAKTKIQRDWDRLNDIHDAQELISTYYRQTSSYPALRSGTFLPGYTVSRWPSWGRLAALVDGALQTDPVNQWDGCGQNDPQTCWDPTESEFLCPARLQVYEYETEGSGANYEFHASFEYMSPTLQIVEDMVDIGHFVNGPSCISGQRYDPFESICGDNVININVGEECDPPGSTFAGTVPCANPNERRSASCNNSCQIVQGACEDTCGNGRVEGPAEQCDDGALNDTYGHCNAACTGPFGDYCGDGNLDQPEEYCDVADDRYDATGFCLKNSCRDGARYGFTNRKPVMDVDTPTGDDAGQVEIAALQIINTTTGWALGVHQPGGLGGVHESIVLRLNTLGDGWTVVYPTSNATSNLEDMYGYDMFFLNANRQLGWIVGRTGGLIGFGRIMRTTNGGTTWINATIAGSGPHPIFRAVWFVDAQDGWAVSDYDSITRTVDGGVNWSLPASIFGNRDMQLNDVQFVNENIGWVVGGDRSGRGRGFIARTTNGNAVSGPTWTLQEQGLPGVMYDIHFLDANIGWAVGGDDQIFRTSDGGNTWLSSPTGNTGADFTAVSFSDLNIGFISGIGAALYSTRDGGRTWQDQSDTITTGRYQWFDDIAAVSSLRAWVGGNSQGGGLYRLDVDLYCTADRLSADHVTECPANACLFGDACVAVTDPVYDAQESNACAIDCRGPGGYCGDGVRRLDYEECDDGNNVDTDACNNFCLTRTATQTALPTGGYCGDGVFPAAGKVCDLGGQNGIACIPEYDRACTYCSENCTQILTVDPIAYCGNGVVDATGIDVRGNTTYEACDISANGIVMSDPDRNPSTPNVPNICPDQGQYACLNNCTSFANQCVACGPRLLAQGGTRPFVSVLNPMIGNNLGTTGIELWRRGLNSLRTPDTEARLYRSGGVMSLGPGYDDLPANFTTPFAQGYNGLGQEFGIESNALCNGAYDIDFNVQSTGGGGDQFPYPVSGGGGVVENEYVVSPPLPPEPTDTDWLNLRIVVRWTKDEFDLGATFVGRLYNEAFSGLGATSVVDLTRAETDAQSNLDFICEDLRRQESPPGSGRYYWIQSGCSANGYENSVHIHPLGALRETFIQAMTVYAGAGSVGAVNADAGNQLNTNYAFFVDAIGQSMSQYKNSNLTVEVYGYNIGQAAALVRDDMSTMSAIYRPMATFSISNVAETALENAEYWHVFNIVRTPRTDGSGTYGYQIQRRGPGPDGGHGTIEAGFPDVLNNIP